VQQKFEGLVGVIHERCCGENAEKFQSVGQKLADANGSRGSLLKCNFF
jgi:hypothetical protein